jgi:two-component system, OmpR family, response regulator MtrA
MTEPILIVEDDGTLASALRYYFERHGYTCLLATDGRTALDLVDRERPALLLLDISLPGIDGLEVCRRVRAGSDLPIILLTARTEEQDRQAGLVAGADDYVTKPVRMADLLVRIERASRKRTAE